MATHRVDGSRACETLLERMSVKTDGGSGLSPRTHQEYAKKISTLVRQIERNGNHKFSPNALVEYISDCIANKKYAQSTTNGLKAAALHWLAAEAQTFIAKGLDIRAHESAFLNIRELSTKGMPTKTLATSSTKLKHFSKDAYHEMVGHAAKNPKDRVAGTVDAFIKANLLVGLRPSEWFDVTFTSYLETDDLGNYIPDSRGRLKATTAMVVTNSKQSYGRSNGRDRIILLHGISNKDLAALMHMKELVEDYKAKQGFEMSHAELAERFYKPMQKKLTSVLTKLGMNKSQFPTLYSTRHQAIANAKLSGLTDSEIAAMFGHFSTMTAKRHYGKKSNGWMKMNFRPAKESVQAVNRKEPMRTIATINDKTIQIAAEWNATLKARAEGTTSKP
jgi:hypothetical protein